jgi:GTPase SAR1 family protein
MSYYYKKEYFKSIKTATKACEVGDYKFALTQLINALDNLNKIDTESDELLRIKAEVNEKIDNIKKMQNKGDSFLIEEIWQLTKSSFVLGKKCTKALFLELRKNSEKTPYTKEKLALFDLGHIFEDKFRANEFPNGINISKTLGKTSLLNSYTNHLLNSTGKQVIFEATIIENDVLIMCDV